ncbi:uncharacterized protein LOC121391054 [Gigantopelta aegis]|uniref:uncharacterized protein LOC121391054 n=1 Tax=Gigantopelta aegis TaxID=1735272 RepID=UPI001B88E507|nr:uncharacterized protein LOC121391054 [Gigantopelta aegis]
MTRSMTAKRKPRCLEDEGPNKSGVVMAETRTSNTSQGTNEPVVFDEGTLPWDRQELIREQWADPALLDARTQVLTNKEIEFQLSAHDAEQESLGFTPFELVYGHSAKGPLKLVKDSSFEDSSSENLLNYQGELATLIKKNLSICQDLPTVTNAVINHVSLDPMTSPIRQHAYRLNPDKRAVLKSEIDYMLKNKIIEHSSSQWASPVILISKEDNSFRMCTDLWRVNQLIQADVYPLPRLDD